MIDKGAKWTPPADAEVKEETWTPPSDAITDEVKKKASSEDVGQDYENVLKSVSQKGSDAVSVLPSAIENLESMPQWAREKILNKQPIIKPIEFQAQDYMVGRQKPIPDMFDEQRKENTKLILSKPSELDVIKDSSVGGIIQSIGNNYVEYSPDKSDVSFWKNVDLNDVPDVLVNFGGVGKGHDDKFGNAQMPLPIKKMVDDYLYYLDKNKPEEFKQFDKDNLSNEEKAKIILESAKHQQAKIKAEYSAKKYKGGALNKLDSDISEDWAWEEKDAQEASQKINEITEDYLYKREGNEIGEAYRNAEIREINKEYEQKITDAQYEAYSNRGGFAANPMQGLYYNIVQPVAERGKDAIRGIATLPRTVGLDEIAPEVFGRIVNDADKFFTPTETETPTKLKADLLGKDGFNFTALIPKLASTLTDFGLLMLGTKGLTSSGLGSKASLITSSFAQTNDNYFNEGRDAGMTKGEATMYGNIAGLIVASLELASPNTNLLTGFKTKVTPLVLKDIAEGKAVKESFESRMKDYLKEVGKEEVQEFSQLFAEKAINYSTNEALGSNLNTDITKNEVFETAVLTFATSGIANLGRLKPVSDFNSSAIYSLSMMDDAKREETIRGGMEKGTITPQQGQQLIDGTNEVRKVLAGIPNKYSDKQKMNLAGLIYQQQLAEKEDKEKVINPAFEKEQPKTSEKIQEEINVLKEEYDSENSKEPISTEARELVPKGNKISEAKNLIPTTEVFKQPVDQSGVFDFETEDERLEFVDKHKDKILTEEVSVDEIIPTQNYIDKANLKKSEGAKEPLLVRTDKGVFVFDGHHRISSNIKAGDTRIKANVIDLTKDVTNKSNINEKVNDQKGRQERLLKPEEISPSQEGEVSVIEEVETPEGITKEMFAKVENGEVIEGVEQEKVEQVKEINDNFDDIIQELNDKGDLIIDCEL